MTAGAANTSLLEVQLKQFVLEKHFCKEIIQYQASLLGRA
jgi:hypothetical protein